MTMATYETAQDQYITVNKTRYAYRKLGPSRGISLVMLMGFRGTMDHWDPALINPLAAQRPVLLLDNPGVGRSAGLVPKTYAGWAQAVINVVSALGLAQIDLFGYSMGGCVAQLVTLNGGGLVRRLVLAGTTPSIGDGVRQYRGREELAAFAQLGSAATEEEHRRAFLAAFFAPTPRSQAAGAKAWERLRGGRPQQERMDYLVGEGVRRQSIAFSKFMDPKQAVDASFQRFDEINMPVLIASGKDDLLLPSENNELMYKKLSDAHLHFFPDSGHGFLYQFAEDFAALINRFLGEASPIIAESKL